MEDQSKLDRRNEPTGTRFVRFERQGWIAMQSNVPLSALNGRDREDSPFELEVSVVPNSVAAMSPALLQACRDAQIEIANLLVHLKEVADKREGEVPWERVKDLLTSRVDRRILRYVIRKATEGASR